MLLRNRGDWRTLVWVALMVLVASAQLATHAMPYLLPLSCYLALSAGVIAHNHNHCPTFRSRRLNNLFAYCLSVFYGYPTFAWIPTHNLNHHKFANRAGDATTSPEARMTSACRPRAMSTTSWPCSDSRAPISPPIAPAP